MNRRLAILIAIVIAMACDNTTAPVSESPTTEPPALVCGSMSDVVVSTTEDIVTVSAVVTLSATDSLFGVVRNPNGQLMTAGYALTVFRPESFFEIDEDGEVIGPFPYLCENSPAAISSTPTVTQNGDRYTLTWVTPLPTFRFPATGNTMFYVIVHTSCGGTLSLLTTPCTSLTM